MPSLREKIEAKKSEEQAAEASLREKLEAEKVKAEEEARLRQLRSKIISREEQKRVLDEAIAAIKGGYVARAGSIESHKKVKITAKAKRESLQKADAVIGKLLEDFKDVFEVKGIKTKGALLGSQDYQAENEVQEYKVAETEVYYAEASKKDAETPIRESAATLRSAKRKAIESAPDLELKEETAFSSQVKEKTLERLSQYSAALEEDLERLKIQTPEGKAEAEKKFNTQFEARFKGRTFFSRQYDLSRRYQQASDTNFVNAEDITDSQKYGQPIVEGALRQQVEEKLKNEVEQEKEKVGILTAKQELETLKQLPEKYRTFVQKVRELEQRREAVIQTLTKKGSAPNLGLDSRMKFYFGHERGGMVGKMLHDGDFARAWLLYTEQNFICESFYGSKYNHVDEKVAKGGVPAILSDFLEKKREVVGDLERRKSWTGSEEVPVRELFDPNSFEQDIKNYEKFLDEFGDIVQNQPESIAQTGRGISGSVEPSDLDLLHDKLGYRTSDIRPFRPLDIKSPKVIEGLSSKKSFRDIVAAVKKAEEPFDKACAERNELLKRLIDKEWSEQELRAFIKAHPEAQALKEKAERIQAQKLAGQEISTQIFKTIKLISAGASGSENAFNKFEFRLSKHRESVGLTIVHPDFESLEKKRETAEIELKEIRRKITINQQEKRPRLSFGKPKLDKELEALQAEEATRKNEFQTADQAFQIVATQQSNLYKNLSPIADALGKGRFDISNETLTISEFLSKIQKMVDDATAVTLSPAEEKIIGEYSKLQKDSLTKRTASENTADTITYQILEQLQAVDQKWSRY